VFEELTASRTNSGRTNSCTTLLISRDAINWRQQSTLS